MVQNIEIIKAWCADENIASAKALERNSFERKEIIESGINVYGEEYDQVVYEKAIIHSNIIESNFGI